MVDDRIILMLLNGHAKEVVAEIEGKYPSANRKTLVPLLACAQAMTGAGSRAHELIRSLSNSSLTGRNLAILKTTEAFLAMNKGDFDEFRSLMEEATSIDEALPLPWLSLGLYYQRHENKFSSARDMYKRALELVPESPVVKQHLMGLEASDGNVSRSRELYRQLKSTDYPVPKVFPLMLALFSTPLHGGLIVLALVGLLFLPYAPILIIPPWMIFSWISYRNLRAISGRLSLTPAIFLVALLGGLVIRWLVLSRVFP